MQNTLGLEAKELGVTCRKLDCATFSTYGMIENFPKIQPVLGFSNFVQLELILAVKKKYARNP